MNDLNIKPEKREILTGATERDGIIPSFKK